MEEKKLTASKEQEFNESDFLLWLSVLAREESADVKISAPDEMTAIFSETNLALKLKKRKAKPRPKQKGNRGNVKVIKEQKALNKPQFTLILPFLRVLWGRGAAQTLAKIFAMVYNIILIKRKTAAPYAY